MRPFGMLWFRSPAEVIQAAGAGPLYAGAFVVMVIGLLTFFLFRHASEPRRERMFVLVLACLGVGCWLGYLAYTKPAASQPPPATSPPAVEAPGPVGPDPVTPPEGPAEEGVAKIPASVATLQGHAWRVESDVGCATKITFQFSKTGLEERQTTDGATMTYPYELDGPPDELTAPVVDAAGKKMVFVVHKARVEYLDRAQNKKIGEYVPCGN